MPVRVLFFDGSIPARGQIASSGVLELGETALTLSGYSDTPLAYADLGVQLKWNGVLTIIQIVHGAKIIHLLVPRINFGGRFVIANAIGTRKLFKRLVALTARPR